MSLINYNDAVAYVQVEIVHNVGVKNVVVRHEDYVSFFHPTFLIVVGANFILFPVFP